MYRTVWAFYIPTLLIAEIAFEDRAYIFNYEEILGLFQSEKSI